VKTEAAHRLFVIASAVAAVVCITELVWLRTARIELTRGMAALLFLPGLGAAAANLELWDCGLVRGEQSPLKKLGISLFWTVSGGFAVGFMTLYGWLLLAA
jgi:hypothetical protein